MYDTYIFKEGDWGIMDNSFEEKKLPYELLPAKAIDELVKVLDFGAGKYSPNGWRHLLKGDLLKLLGAAMRHVFAYLRGQQNDKETGLHHLAHAACDLFFILELEHKFEEKKNGNEETEDYKTSPA